MTNAVFVAIQLVAGTIPGMAGARLSGEPQKAVFELRPAYVKVCTNRCSYCKAFEAYRKDLDRVGNRTVYVVPPEGQCSCRYERRLDHYDLVPDRRAE